MKTYKLFFFNDIEAAVQYHCTIFQAFEATRMGTLELEQYNITKIKLQTAYFIETVPH